MKQRPTGSASSNPPSDSDDGNQPQAQEYAAVHVIMDVIMLLIAVAGVFVSLYFKKRIKNSVAPDHSSEIYRHAIFQFLITISIMILAWGAALVNYMADASTFAFFRVIAILTAMIVRTCFVCYTSMMSIRKHKEVVADSWDISEDDLCKTEGLLSSLLSNRMIEYVLYALTGLAGIVLIGFTMAGGDHMPRLLLYGLLGVKASLEIYATYKEIQLESKLGKIYKQHWLEHGGGK